VRGVALSISDQVRDQQDTGVTDEEWMQSQDATFAAMAAGRFPHLAALIQQRIDMDLESLFEFGLQRLLDGYATLLAPGH
jgi:hypothetical protein